MAMSYHNRAFCTMNTYVSINWALVCILGHTKRHKGILRVVASGGREQPALMSFVANSLGFICRERKYPRKLPLLDGRELYSALRSAQWPIGRENNVSWLRTIFAADGVSLDNHIKICGLLRFRDHPCPVSLQAACR